MPQTKPEPKEQTENNRCYSRDQDEFPIFWGHGGGGRLIVIVL